MKAAKTHSTTNNLHTKPSSQSNTPFFQKPLANGLYPKRQEASEPFFKSASQLQYKLSIGAPNDKYEKEADSVADNVVKKLSNNKVNTANTTPEVQAKNASSLENKETTPARSNNTTVQAKSIFESSSSSFTPKPFAPLIIQHRLEESTERNLQQKEEETTESNIEQETTKLSSSSNEDDESNKKNTANFQGDVNFGSPSVQLKSFNSPIIQRQEFHEDRLEKNEEEDMAQSDVSIPDESMFGSSKEEEKVQRKTNGDTESASSDLESRLSSTKGSGQSMPSDVQSDMGNAMGSDFSDVKIHTDSKAVQMNQELGAQAFTHGSDVYFNEGKYDTKSDSGKHLLAHELTHTVQQGAAIQKKGAITPIPRLTIQRGLVGWVTDKISNGVDYVKSQISATLNSFAEQFLPGYSLLNVILGRNLITGARVDRTGVNIIKGYLELMPLVGTILYEELRDSQSLQEAGTWIDNKLEKLGVNFEDITLKLNAAWEEMGLLKGIEGNLAIFKKHLGGTIRRFSSLAGMVEKKVKVLRVEATLRLAGAHELLSAVQKDPEAMQKLVDDPKLILKYFLQALQQGFTNFRTNFGKHFKAALFGWLFGKTAEMGLEIPKQMNIAGLFSLMAQLLGLTYRQVRTQVVAKLGPKGESIVAKLEQTAEVVIDFMTRGPIALWDRVKESLVNLKDMVFAKITELVTSQLIQAVVTKLVSMLNPAGALLQLVMTIYKVVKYFIDWWDRIKEIASGVLSSITKVVTGAIATAASFLENTFARGMTVFIGFLANILGLDGLVGKVRALIKKISTPVKQAVDKVVAWIVEKGKALLAKGKEGISSATAAVSHWWKRRKKFVNKAKEDHTLFFKGSGGSAKLMIASKVMPIEEYLGVQEKTIKQSGNRQDLNRVKQARILVTKIKKLTSSKVHPRKEALINEHINSLSGILKNLGIAGTEGAVALYRGIHFKITLPDKKYKELIKKDFAGETQLSQGTRKIAQQLTGKKNPSMEELLVSSQLLKEEIENLERRKKFKPKLHGSTYANQLLAILQLYVADKKEFEKQIKEKTKGKFLNTEFRKVPFISTSKDSKQAAQYAINGKGSVSDKEQRTHGVIGAIFIYLFTVQELIEEGSIDVVSLHEPILANHGIRKLRVEWQVPEAEVAFSGHIPGKNLRRQFNVKGIDTPKDAGIRAKKQAEMEATRDGGLIDTK